MNYRARRCVSCEMQAGRSKLIRTAFFFPLHSRLHVPAMRKCQLMGDTSGTTLACGTYFAPGGPSLRL